MAGSRHQDEAEPGLAERPGYAHFSTLARFLT